MSSSVRKLELAGRTFTLVGTAHISLESVEEVKQIITETKPGHVCVEIDQSRYTAMTQESRWESLDIIKVLKEGKGFFLMANLALSGFQKHYL